MIWFFHILNCIKFITFDFVLLLINPEYSLERLLLKLKLQYFSHLIQRADSLDNTLKLRKGISLEIPWRQKEKGVAEDEVLK